MAIVKMLTRVSGTRNGKDWPERGGTLEVSADEAATLVAIGVAIAEDVDGTEPEAAAVDLDGVENAAAKRARGRKTQ